MIIFILPNYGNEKKKNSTITLIRAFFELKCLKKILVVANNIFFLLCNTAKTFTRFSHHEGGGDQKKTSEIKK